MPPSHPSYLQTASTVVSNNHRGEKGREGRQEREYTGEGIHRRWNTQEREYTGK